MDYIVIYRGLFLASSYSISSNGMLPYVTMIDHEHLQSIGCLTCGPLLGDFFFTTCEALGMIPMEVQI